MKRAALRPLRYSCHLGQQFEILNSVQFFGSGYFEVLLRGRVATMVSFQKKCAKINKVKGITVGTK